MLSWNHSFLKNITYTSNTLGTQHEAGLPNITGAFNTIGVHAGLINGANANGVFSLTTTSSTAWAGYDGDRGGIGTVSFSAKTAYDIYGRNASVQPKSLVLRPIIRYI